MYLLGIGSSQETAPNPPTSVGGSAGNNQVSVTFTAPAYNGGSAITYYTAIASPGGGSNTGASSPIVITGLTNNQPYTFTVKATNAIGTSQPSVPSAAITPNDGTTVPGAPTSVSASAGNASATVSFSAPGSNGGRSITSYTVTSSRGDTKSGASSPITIGGLTNGLSYTFTVAATNVNGTGTSSSPSSAVTPSTLPGAPAIGSATVLSSTSILVSFTAPASDGGSPITSYTIYSSSGGYSRNVSNTPPVRSASITVGAGTYTFHVTATNANGEGPVSGNTNQVTTLTPATVSAPDISVIKSTVSSNGNVSGSSTATVSNGAGPFTYSWVMTSGSGFSLSGATSATVTATLTLSGVNAASGTAQCTVTDTGNNNVTCLTSINIYLERDAPAGGFL